jgi:hypothetical protein
VSGAGMRAVRVFVVLLAVFLPACPKCPTGFHRVVTRVDPRDLQIRQFDVGNLPMDTGLDVVETQTYDFTATGTIKLHETGQSFGPNGSNETPKEGSPAPGGARGALIGVVADKYYYLGARMVTTFSPGGRLHVIVNEPPPAPAPPSPVPAPPNSVSLNIDLHVDISEGRCIKDDEPDPPPPPPPKTWSEVYTTYFAAGTPGNCTGCHMNQPGRPNFGSSAATMWSALSTDGYLPGGAKTRIDFVLRWCTATGTMPKNNPAENAAGCAAVQSWLNAGALNN